MKLTTKLIIQQIKKIVDASSTQQKSVDELPRNTMFQRLKTPTSMNSKTESFVHSDIAVSGITLNKYTKNQTFKVVSFWWYRMDTIFWRRWIIRNRWHRKMILATFDENKNMYPLMYQKRRWNNLYQTKHRNGFDWERITKSKNDFIYDVEILIGKLIPHRIVVVSLSVIWTWWRKMTLVFKELRPQFM